MLKLSQLGAASRVPYCRSVARMGSLVCSPRLNAPSSNQTTGTTICSWPAPRQAYCYKEKRTRLHSEDLLGYGSPCLRRCMPKGRTVLLPTTGTVNVYAARSAKAGLVQIGRAWSTHRRAKADLYYATLPPFRAQSEHEPPCRHRAPQYTLHTAHTLPTCLSAYVYHPQV